MSHRAIYQRTGFVVPTRDQASPASPPPPPPGTSVVYYGFVQMQAPDAGTVQGLTAAQRSGSTGVYSCSQVDGSDGYPCFALPASFGVPGTVVIGGFAYTFNETQVSIAGVGYNVFVSPTATYSTTVNIQVTA